jgi:hydroxymethylbilane synthase
MTAPLLRIGSRGSPLALAQVEEVRRRLGAAHPELVAPGAIDVTIIKTTGDLVRDRTLAAVGGKGMFTKEIEEALLAGTIDLAVHSMKDVTTFLPERLAITACLPREDPRDAFFSRDGCSFRDLPAGAVVGTASLRRQAMVLHARPDLRVVPLRGNVETRLRKLQDGAVDATLLALAGLKRLGLDGRATEILPTELMLPAAAQGAIGIETRRDDDRTNRYVAALDDAATAARITAERALLAALDGSCRTPIAAIAEIDAGGGTLQLRAAVVRPDGTERHDAVREGAPSDAAALGAEAGEELRQRAGPGFFDLPLPLGTPA